MKPRGEMEKNLPVSMKRDNLDGIPTIEPPAGYILEWYRPGDAEAWLEVQKKAERYLTITRQLYAAEFGTSDELLAERQCFLRLVDATPVATATAWFYGESPSSTVGRVHWVAVAPEHQGKGLGKVVLSAVCRRMKELGHTSALLGTHSRRIPAINLYLSFGFVPDIRSEEEAAVWRELRPSLKFPI